MPTAKATISKAANIKPPRMRFFYRTDGTRESVTLGEYNRRVKAAQSRGAPPQKTLEGRYRRRLKAANAESGQTARTSWSRWHVIETAMSKGEFIRKVYDAAKSSRFYSLNRGKSVDGPIVSVAIELRYRKDGKTKRVAQVFTFSVGSTLADGDFHAFFDAVLNDDTPDTLEGRLASLANAAATSVGATIIAGRYMSADSSGDRKFNLRTISDVKARFRFV